MNTLKRKSLHAAVLAGLACIACAAAAYASGPPIETAQPAPVAAYKAAAVQSPAPVASVVAIEAQRVSVAAVSAVPVAVAVRPHLVGGQRAEFGVYLALYHPQFQPADSRLMRT